MHEIKLTVKQILCMTLVKYWDKYAWYYVALRTTCTVNIRIQNTHGCNLSNYRPLKLLERSAVKTHRWRSTNSESDVWLTVHRNSVWIRKPTRSHLCILYFSSTSRSTCFGQPCAHHQELTTAWCYSLVLVCTVAAGRLSRPVDR